MITEVNRPKEFGDVVGQGHIVPRLKVYAEKRNIPNMIFHGLTGTGKTTCARILIHEILGDEIGALVLNSSKERGIDVIRGKISEYAKTQTLASVPFKIVFLDEADRLTKEAQWALRGTMENYTNNIRFILACENVNKIIPAIRGRAANYRFKPITNEDMMTMFRRVCSSNKIPLNRDAAEMICNHSSGNLRGALNILGTIADTHIGDDKITVNEVKEFVGIPAKALVKKVLESSLKNDGKIEIQLNALLKEEASWDNIIDLMMDCILEFDIGGREKSKMIYNLGKLEGRIMGGCIPKLQMRVFLYSIGEF